MVGSGVAGLRAVWEGWERYGRVGSGVGGCRSVVRGRGSGVETLSDGREWCGRAWKGAVVCWSDVGDVEAFHILQHRSHTFQHRSYAHPRHTHTISHRTHTLPHRSHAISHRSNAIPHHSHAIPHRSQPPIPSNVVSTPLLHRSNALPRRTYTHPYRFQPPHTAPTPLHGAPTPSNIFPLRSHTLSRVPASFTQVQHQFYRPNALITNNALCPKQELEASPIV